MKLPAWVRVSGIPNEFPTETVNVSARGIFFYLDRLLKEGAQVEITMEFPPQITLAEPLRLRFFARVVRVIPGKTDTRLGIAAAIEHYEFLPPANGSQNLVGMDSGWSFAQ